jgi:hypothetical protein
VHGRIATNHIALPLREGWVVGFTGITFELLLEEDLPGDGGDGGEREQRRDGARRSPADRHPRRRPRRETLQKLSIRSDF